MKDRLIELLKSIPHGTNTFGDVTENLYIENVMAKHLLANGVIVPPCKVGEVVWIIDCYNKIQKCEIFSVNYHKNRNDGMWLHGIKTENFITLTFEDDDIGKTVFLIREEAEKALQEVKGK